MVEQRRYCGHCGLKLPLDAKFCGGCGSAQLEWEVLRQQTEGKAPDTSDSPIVDQVGGRAAGLNFASFLLICLLGFFGFHWWQNTSTSASQKMSGQRVVLEQGIEVVAQPGSLPEAVKLRVETSEKGPSLEPFERCSKFVTVSASCPTVNLKDVSVTVPINGQVEYPGLMVKSLGRWLLIPARKVETSVGPALQVKFRKLPFPWCLAVVDAHREVTLVEPRSPESALARLEQLRLIDHERFLRECDSYKSFESLSASLIPRHPLFKSAVAAPRIAGTVQTHLNQARFSFLKAQAALEDTKDPDGWSCKWYVLGLKHLLRGKEALQELSSGGKSPEVEDWDKALNDSFFGGTWKLDHLLEHYCGTFAPWGLEFTVGVLSAPDIAQRGFDVRVVPALGNLTHVNTTLPGGLTQPLKQDGRFTALSVNQSRIVEKMKLDPELTKVSYTVQFYSPKLYQTRLKEYLANAGSTVSVVGTAIGLVATVETAPVVVMGWAGYTLLFPIVKDIFVDNSPPHGFSIFDERLHKVIGLLAPSPTWATLSTVALEGVIEFEKTQTLERVKDDPPIAKGYQNKYGTVEEHPVPAIILTCNIFGPRERLLDEKLGSYDVGGLATTQFMLHYAALASPEMSGSYDLSTAFKLKRRELGIPIDSDFSAKSLYGSHWKAFHPENWPVRMFDSAPHLQVVEWRLPRAQLSKWGFDTQKQRDKFLSQTKVEICQGSSWVESASKRAQSVQANGVDLQSALLAENKEDQTFAVALITPRLFDEEFKAHNMSEKFVGKWHTLPLFRYRSRAARNFTLRLVHEKKEVLRLPVSFAPGVSKFENVPDNSVLLEHVVVNPDFKPPQGKIVIRKQPLPPKELERFRLVVGEPVTAREVTVEFLDGRPPIVKRFKGYRPTESSVLELEGVDFTQVKTVSENLFTPKHKEPYLSLLTIAVNQNGVGQNDRWKNLLAGQSISYKQLTYRYEKDKSGREILYIDEDFNKGGFR